MLRRITFIIFSILAGSALTTFAQNQKVVSFYFDTDERKLNNKQEQELSAFIQNLDTASVVSIAIKGFCDDRGREGYNDTLSIDRADYIKNRLVASHGCADKIILLKGNGKINLQNQVSVDEQRLNNRRVDVILTLKEKPSLIHKLLADDLKIGDKFVLENVLFQNSKSTLLPESIAVVERVADALLAKQQYNVIILGHICCNPPGKDVRDLVTGLDNLSEARAKLIYDYLIYRGVDKKRLSYKGMMANQPLGGLEKYDRRVEIQITGINNAGKTQ